jgi:hypothetical protein
MLRPPEARRVAPSRVPDAQKFDAHRKCIVANPNIQLSLMD